MKAYQSSSFAKKVKKFKKKEKEILDIEIKDIIQNPSLCSEKKGDVRGIFLHKFKIKKTPFLHSYRMVGEDLEIIMIGPQENNYLDLKVYHKKDK